MNKSSKKYARALFESYQPAVLREKSLAVSALAVVLSDNEEFISFFNNPSVSLENKEKTALEAVNIAAPGDNILANFIRVVIANSVINNISAIAESFNQLVAEWEKSLELTVTLASAATEAEKSNLLERLKNEFGAGVSVSWQVAPELIGGFTVKSGDKLLDSSVAGSLDKIRKSLIA